MYADEAAFAGAAADSRSVLEWLLSEAPDLALTAVATAVAALWWPDSDSGAKTTAFCRSVWWNSSVMIALQDNPVIIAVQHEFMRCCLAIST